MYDDVLKRGYDIEKREQEGYVVWKGSFFVGFFCVMFLCHVKSSHVVMWWVFVFVLHRLPSAPFLPL